MHAHRAPGIMTKKGGGEERKLQILKASGQI